MGPCECGCGELTETGKFKRGHATRLRWQAIKAVVNDGGVVKGNSVTADDAAVLLRHKNWNIPTSNRTFGIEIESSPSPTAWATAR